MRASVRVRKKEREELRMGVMMRIRERIRRVIKGSLWVRPWECALSVIVGEI